MPSQRTDKNKLSLPDCPDTLETNESKQTDDAPEETATETLLLSQEQLIQASTTVHAPTVDIVNVDDASSSFVTDPYTWDEDISTDERGDIVISAESIMKTNKWTRLETLDFLTHVLILTHPHENRPTNAKATLLGEDIEWVICEEKIMEWKLTVVREQIRKGMALDRIRQTLLDVLHAKLITRKSAPIADNRPPSVQTGLSMVATSSPEEGEFDDTATAQAPDLPVPTTTTETMAHDEQQWAANGGDTIGYVLNMTPTQLATWNSMLTSGHEAAQREFISNLKGSLVGIPDERLRNFNDGHYLIGLKNQALSEQNPMLSSSKTIDKFLSNKSQMANQEYPPASEGIEDSVEGFATTTDMPVDGNLDRHYTSLPLLLEPTSILLQLKNVPQQFTGCSQIIDATLSAHSIPIDIFDSDKLMRLDATVSELIKEIKSHLNLNSCGPLVLMKQGSTDALCKSRHIGHYFVS